MKLKIYLLIALLGIVCFVNAQTLTNTSTVITLTSTCLVVPNGSYTLTLQYNDLDTTSIPWAPTNMSGTATASTTGSVITLTTSGVTLPTVASTGYYALSDCAAGTIKLTSGANSYYCYWDVHNIHCETTHPTISGMNAALVSGKVNLTWTLTNAGSVTQEDWHEIGEYLGGGGGSFTDNAPGTNNTYYVALTTSQGTCVSSSAISMACGTCTYTPPTPVSCTPSLTGSYTLCNNETQNHYSAIITPYLDHCTWTISPNIARIIASPCEHGGAVYLIRNGNGPGIAQLTLTQSTCTGPGESIYVLIGTPTTANITSNCVSGLCTVSCDLFPGTADSAYHWTLDLGTHGGKSYYTGRSKTLNQIPCKTNGTLSIAVNTPCGQVTQGNYLVRNTMNCAVIFSVTPNPATSTATVSSISPSTTIRSVEVFDKTGAKRSTIVLSNVSKASLNLSSLPADIYTLNITSTAGEVESKQLIISK